LVFGKEKAPGIDSLENHLEKIVQNRGTKKFKFLVLCTIVFSYM